jgi:hypothetical protein
MNPGIESQVGRGEVITRHNEGNGTGHTCTPPNRLMSQARPSKQEHIHPRWRKRMMVFDLRGLVFIVSMAMSRRDTIWELSGDEIGSEEQVQTSFIRRRGGAKLRGWKFLVNLLWMT